MRMIPEIINAVADHPVAGAWVGIVIILVAWGIMPFRHAVIMSR